MDPSQALIHPFDPNETLKLQMYGSKPYLFKLQTQSTEYLVEDKSSLNLLLKSYISHFTHTRRAKDRQVLNLTSQFLDTVKSYFRNLKLNLDQFSSFTLSLHDTFHTSLIELQRSAACSILQNSKNKFHFTPLLSRFLLKDVVLEEREAEYLTEVTLMESFNQDKIKTLFIDKFENFITGYSLDKEEVILGIILKSLKTYLNEEAKLIEETVSMLKKCLQDTINSVKATKTFLLMMQIPDGEGVKHWEVVTEVVFDNEEIELKQVNSMGVNGIIATLSLKQSNLLLMVFGENFFAKVCESDVVDYDTVVCEGSNRDNLVYFCNNLKKCVIAYEQENKIVVRKEIPFEKGLDAVRSAVLVQKGVVGIVSEKGDFSLLKLEGSDSVNGKQVCVLPYRRISLSQCMNFVVLESESAVFVFDSNLQMIILDYGRPVFVFMTGTMLHCVERICEEELGVREVEYPFSYEKVKKNEKYSDKISIECSKTLHFGKNLLTDMIKGNKFVSHSKN